MWKHEHQRLRRPLPDRKGLLVLMTGITGPRNVDIAGGQDIRRLPVPGARHATRSVMMRQAAVDVLNVGRDIVDKNVGSVGQGIHIL